MSKYIRIALVAEGITDAVVIESALQAIITQPFILTLLQPEATFPEIGSGWGGVYRWCRQIASRMVGALEHDPSLNGYDLFIIHLDADVAKCSYKDLGKRIEEEAQAGNLPPLPVQCNCPPPTCCPNALRQHILAWLGMSALGCRTVLCIPSLSTPAWLAAALCSDSPILLSNIECNQDVKEVLNQLPKRQRVRNSRKSYTEQAPKVKEHWCSHVKTYCVMAGRFSDDVLNALARQC